MDEALHLKVPEMLRHRAYARERYLDIAARAYQGHPFYRRYREAGLRLAPVLTRADILEHNEALLNGHPVTGLTSGSTGIPVKVHMGPGRMSLEHRDHDLSAAWLGGKKRPMAIISRRASKDLPQDVYVTSPPDQQVDFIREQHARRSVKSLITYPTNAAILSEHLLATGSELPFLERIVLQSESLMPFEENLINAAFPRVQVACSYSSIELGLIGMRCPHDHRYYHLMSHKLGVEVLDDNDEPCAEGQIGRVVVTDYFNRRMPLLRYEIGDLAASDQCGCGVIGRPSVCRLAGKIRHTVKHPDGRRLSFADFGGVIRESGVRQFQLIQRAVTDFELTFVPGDGTDIARFEDTLQREFAREFGFDANIALVQVTALGREPSGKFFLFKSMV